MVEDVFLGEEAPTYVDYADVQTMRRLSTFKVAVSYGLAVTYDNYLEHLLEVIDDVLTDKKPCFCFLAFEVNSAVESNTYVKEIFDSIVDRISTSGATEVQLDILYSIKTLSNMDKDITVNVMFAVPKSDEDKMEDERVKRLLKEYCLEKRPPFSVNLDEWATIIE
ncbi:MAG: hypothetical protein J6Q40_02545 [Tidjanibacter sp.]|nr:hypothetical protein [Tidjanibacter sp.]